MWYKVYFCLFHKHTDTKKNAAFKKKKKVLFFIEKSFEEVEGPKGTSYEPLLAMLLVIISSLHSKYRRTYIYIYMYIYKYIFSCWCYLWYENSVLLKCIYSIDNLHTIGSPFISKRKRGQEGKIAERKRESEGERMSMG